MATTRSMNPGTSAQQTRTLGLATSTSWDLPSPVEYGRKVTEPAPDTTIAAAGTDKIAN